jgi:uncharacterized membrane protein
MEQLFLILLVVHVIAGSIALITGTINMVRKKGDKMHKNLGNYFFYSMIINSIAGMFMSFIHINIFLFIIGVFTIYLVVTGQRYLVLKDSTTNTVKKLDWIISYTMILFAIGFIIYGILLLLSSKFFGVVLLTFGLISTLMSLQDFKNYKGKSTLKNVGLITHIQRMIGAYIAAITAFLVVNNTFLPSVLAWLLPTLILVPLIIYWSRKHKISKT